MSSGEIDLQSKRARQIIVKGDDSDGAHAPTPDRTPRQVKAVMDLRDRFDSDSPQVGIRDSSWLIVGTLVLLVVALNWGEPKGLDLFARLLLLGGGVAIIAAVIGRNLLARQ